MKLQVCVCRPGRRRGRRSSPLVLRLLQVSGDVLNLSLKPLLPLLRRKVREIFCSRRLNTHRCTHSNYPQHHVDDKRLNDHHQMSLLPVSIRPFQHKRETQRERETLRLENRKHTVTHTVIDGESEEEERSEPNDVPWEERWDSAVPCFGPTHTEQQGRLFILWCQSNVHLGENYSYFIKENVYF